MAVTVDLSGLTRLLHERGRESLPFAVRPGRGLAPADILRDTRLAIAEADAVAVSRSPSDPTSTTEADATRAGVVAEIVDGPRTDEEITLWLADLVSGLEARGVRGRVVPRAPDSRVPDFVDWLSGAPAPTALLSFTTTGQGVARHVPTETLRAVLPAVAAWTRVPAATTLLSLGLDTAITSPGRVVAEVEAALPLDPQQLRIASFTSIPRRMRYLDVQLQGQGSLQVIDETRDVLACTATLLEGLSLLAPHLDYAAVRRAQPVIGSHGDAPFSVGRDLTSAEHLVTRHVGLDRLDTSVVDAYAAQVLTDHHLERLTVKDGFDVRPVGNGRHLVVARDLNEWMADPLPRPEAWTSARAAFAPLFLASEAQSD